MTITRLDSALREKSPVFYAIIYVGLSLILNFKTVENSFESTFQIYKLLRCKKSLYLSNQEFSELFGDEVKIETSTLKMAWKFTKCRSVHVSNIPHKNGVRAIFKQKTLLRWKVLLCKYFCLFLGFNCSCTKLICIMQHLLWDSSVLTLTILKCKPYKLETRIRIATLSDR